MAPHRISWAEHRSRGGRIYCWVMHQTLQNYLQCCISWESHAQWSSSENLRMVCPSILYAKLAVISEERVESIVVYPISLLCEHKSEIWSIQVLCQIRMQFWGSTQALQGLGKQTSKKVIEPLIEMIKEAVSSLDTKHQELLNCPLLSHLSLKKAAPTDSVTFSTASHKVNLFLLSIITTLLAL